jgi:hypothetical protein
MRGSRGAAQRQDAERRRGRVWPLLLALGTGLAGPASGLAGEQLSLPQLVDRSAAVIVIDNRLDRGARPRIWLKGDATQADRVAALGGVCVPDRAILAGWMARHPRHASRATWQQLLDAGGGDQIVFLRSRDTELEAFCGTEVMLGRSFALHPDHAAFRAELATLLARSPTRTPAAPVPMPPRR